MIDSIFVPPFVHLVMGLAVLVSNGLLLVVAAWLAFRKQALTSIARGLFILFQLALMIQALIGIKLLDQGLGFLQLYIHYLGGLAPLFFCLLYYWLAAGKAPVVQSRHVAIVAAVSLFFTVLTYTVGSMYVADGA